VQKRDQKTRQGDTPWNPGLANSLRLEQSSPRTREGAEQLHPSGASAASRRQASQN